MNLLVKGEHFDLIYMGVYIEFNIYLKSRLYQGLEWIASHIRKK